MGGGGDRDGSGRTPCSGRARAESTALRGSGPPSGEKPTRKPLAWWRRPPLPGAVVDAGFADHHPIPRSWPPTAECGQDRRSNPPQIPVADANHRGAEVDGAGQLFLVAHLGEHPVAQFFRHFEQGAIPSSVSTESIRGWRPPDSGGAR